MNKEIKVTPRFKIKVIPQNYQLVEFVEGGKEARNPSTGETMITESKWQTKDVYYARLDQMVGHIARLEADNEAETLNEWLDKYQKVADEISTNWLIATGV